MGTGKKGVCTERGGSQQARGRDYGHFKQSREAGSAKQGTSAQGQCMASRWGRQGCRAATEGLEDAGPWAKEGRRKAAWTGRGLPAFLPPRAPPTRCAGGEDPGAVPPQSPPPALHCLCPRSYLPQKVHRPPPSLAPESRTEGLRKQGEVAWDPWRSSSEAGQGAVTTFLGHLKMGPPRGLNPKATLNKLTKYIQVVNK